MYMRRHFLPKTLVDAFCCGFVFGVIPIVYYFELFIVLPTYYDQWSGWYNFHFILANFVAMNLIGNLIAVVLVDTSVKGRMMATEMKPGWHFCASCESFVPPRSWHCNTCRTCILKRDHHCVFSGCCIGHDNSRYFIMFVAYLSIATVYSTYFNCYFMWNRIEFSSAFSLLKVIFPMAMLIYESTENQLYLSLFVVVVIGMVFGGILLWYHGSLILRGQVTYEKKSDVCYDYGSSGNLKMVFGERWYLTWVSPFIRSKLPHDGVYWETIKSK